MLGVWRILSRWFNPQSVGLHAASLTNILNPKAAKDIRDLPQCIDSWKDRIRRYYAKTGMEPLNEPTRLSLLLGMCPPQLREAMET